MPRLTKLEREQLAIKQAEEVAKSAKKAADETEQLQYIHAAAKIASVIQEMYVNIYTDLATKTNDPHELTLKMIQAGYDSALASINIKSSHKFVTNKIGFRDYTNNI